MIPAAQQDLGWEQARLSPLATPPHPEVTLHTETALLSVCKAVTGCLPWLAVPQGSTSAFLPKSGGKPPCILLLGGKEDWFQAGGARDMICPHLWARNAKVTPTTLVSGVFKRMQGMWRQIPWRKGMQKLNLLSPYQMKDWVT